MKLFKTLIAAAFACALVASTALAGDKTCCEKAKADGKECSHKCCAAAHKDGKSCEKCNPNKEDAPQKDAKKGEAKKEEKK